MNPGLALRPLGAAGLPWPAVHLHSHEIHVPPTSRHLVRVFERN